MLNIYQHRNHQWISMVNQFWAKSIYIPCFCHGLPRFWDRIQPSLVPAVELPAGCPTAWAFATSKRKHESCVKVEESQVPRKDLEQILKNDGKLWQIRGFLSAKSLKVTSHYPVVLPEMVAIFDPGIVDQIISPAPVIGRHDGEVGIIRYCRDWKKKIEPFTQPVFKMHGKHTL